MALIKLENINQIFGLSSATKTALSQINLEIEQGDFMAVMGPSGSGKTSLLNVIGLLIQPTDGQHIFLEHNISQITQTQKAKLRRWQIGFIFQNFNLLPNTTIVDNVALPLIYSSNAGFLKRIQKVKKILSRLGIHNKEFLYPYQLSGGQQQRVAIARALVNQPSLIVADEPTGSLDSVASETIMRILDNLHQKGNTIIMATHNPILTRYANRIIYMHDGQIRINQKLAKNQQVDLGKMQDAIRKQSLRTKRRRRGLKDTKLLDISTDIITKKTKEKGDAD